MFSHVLAFYLLFSTTSGDIVDYWGSNGCWLLVFLLVWLEYTVTLMLMKPDVKETEITKPLLRVAGI